MTVARPALEPALVAPGALNRVTRVIADLLSGLAVIFSLPFVILAIGIPVALCARLLLWTFGML